jgi:hypothetical protein
MGYEVIWGTMGCGVLWGWDVGLCVAWCVWRCAVWGAGLARGSGARRGVDTESIDYVILSIYVVPECCTREANFADLYRLL